jgi:heat shock protein HslJ
MREFVFLALLIACTAAAFAQPQPKPGNETLIVADGIVECPLAAGNRKCLIVSDDRVPAVWRYFGETIAGFKFREGHTQKISVRREPGTAGTGPVRWKLVRVLSSQKTGGRTFAEARTQVDERRRPVLDGRNWVLTRIDGQPSGIDSAVLRFNSPTKRFAIKICNQFSGQFAQDGLNLTITDVISTKMMCGDPLGPIEFRFQAALAKVNRAETDGAGLFLMADGKVVLEFAERASLEDVNWGVTEVGGKKVVTSGDVPYINLSKSSLTGFTACNQIFGKYVREGGALRFSDVGMTKMACTEDGVADIEIGIVDAIKRSERFEINNGALVIFAGDKVLMTLNAIAK